MGDGWHGGLGKVETLESGQMQRGRQSAAPALPVTRPDAYGAADLSVRYQRKFTAVTSWRSSP
ncbi:hypothetical protein Pstr01_13370 [Pseudomonas straminea]|nr:hypothetical protein Pstr01_13370 [Pseudomonas straminea]